MKGRARIVVAALAVAALTAAAVIGATTTHRQREGSGAPSRGHSDYCKLDNGIKHVIYLQFDNTHLFRDRQQFASDLEQMPHLQNFLKGNGTLSDNEHTILISHTAGGILSSLTGLYPDRHGQAVSNSYGYFQAERDGGLPVLVQVLDGRHRRRQPRHHAADSVRGPELQHGQRRLRHGQEHACAVGALGQGRL